MIKFEALYINRKIKECGLRPLSDTVLLSCVQKAQALFIEWKDDCLEVEARYQSLKALEKKKTWEQVFGSMEDKSIDSLRTRGKDGLEINMLCARIAVLMAEEWRDVKQLQTPKSLQSGLTIRRKVALSLLATILYDIERSGTRSFFLSFLDSGTARIDPAPFELETNHDIRGSTKQNEPGASTVTIPTGK